MMADRYRRRMETVLEAVEDELLRRLTLETCGEMLATGAASDLTRVEGQIGFESAGRFPTFQVRTEHFSRV
jgi:hypothetical protein